jgi:hypothetical protein
MKAVQIRRLMLATLVAVLPIACGTQSVVGPDSVDSLTAMRAEPLPPTAPAPPTTEQVPVPSPKPTDEINRVVPPTSGENDPAETDPKPTKPTKPSPSPTAEPGPAPQPTADPGPVPQPTADPGTVPSRPAEPGTAIPAPQPNADVDRASLCFAAQSQLYVRRGSLPAPSLSREPILLELVMLDAKGAPVDEQSCRAITWTVAGERVGAGYAAGPVINVAANRRFATVDGSGGSFVILATTPNGLIAAVTIELQ